ncbi:MAG: hypothetical protein Q8K45_14585 [Rubrivivax sp.]|nr:hypothetical protein [Rubrivivax sp.]
MDFDSFLDQAWTDHAEHAAAVAARLADPGVGLLAQEEQVAQLAGLAHHVHGQHLGSWADGVAFQQQLAKLPLVSAGSSTAQALQRYGASLQLAGGLDDARGGGGEAIRLTAMAAAVMTVHDTPRARALLEEAAAAATALPDTDPAVRAVAVAGNNMASTLEDLPVRSEAERALMIAAASTARLFWARAGTWRETERADYRLAKTWLQAGDATQALHHARLCLDTVQAHGNVALERFFGLEVLALAQRSAGDTDACAETVAQMRVTFDALDEGDQGWCRPALSTIET